MTITLGSTYKYPVQTKSTPWYPYIVQDGNTRRIFQPGNGRIVCMGYPRTNIVQGSIPSYGHASKMNKYIRGNSNCTWYNSFGVSVTSSDSVLPEGYTGVNYLSGTNAPTSSQVAAFSGTALGYAKSYVCGVKVTGISSVKLVALVCISPLAGNSVGNIQNVRLGFLEKTSANVVVSATYQLMTEIHTNLYVVRKTLSLSSTSNTLYVTFPIIVDSTAFLSGQSLGVQSYFSFEK